MFQWTLSVESNNLKPPPSKQYNESQVKIPKFPKKKLTNSLQNQVSTIEQLEVSSAMSSTVYVDTSGSTVKHMRNIVHHGYWMHHCVRIAWTQHELIDMIPKNRRLPIVSLKSQIAPFLCIKLYQTSDVIRLPSLDSASRNVKVVAHWW